MYALHTVCPVFLEVKGGTCINCIIKGRKRKEKGEKGDKIFFFLVLTAFVGLFLGFWFGCVWSAMVWRCWGVCGGFAPSACGKLGANFIDKALP